VGVMLAVPLAAVIGVLVRFTLRQYLANPLYHGYRRTDAGSGAIDP
ncbi:MAG: AI-2E family transporter, partial [Caldilineales bacterium]|nr:AI-2E family transporter [Caldilineales bacterium]